MKQICERARNSRSYRVNRACNDLRHCALDSVGHFGGVAASDRCDDEVEAGCTLLGHSRDG